MKWTFFAGLGVGAAVGMIFAPKAGAELRQDMQEFALDSYERGRERLDPVVDKARQRVEPVVGRVREQVDAAMSQATDVRDRAADKVDDWKQKISSGGLMSILNEWPHDRLIEIEGIGPVLASKIIQHRPYESEQALIDSKELPPSAIESLRKAA